MGDGSLELKTWVIIFFFCFRQLFLTRWLKQCFENILFFSDFVFNAWLINYLFIFVRYFFIGDSKNGCIGDVSIFALFCFEFELWSKEFFSDSCFWQSFFRFCWSFFLLFLNHLWVFISMVSLDFPIFQLINFFLWFFFARLWFQWCVFFWRSPNQRHESFFIKLASNHQLWYRDQNRRTKFLIILLSHLNRFTTFFIESQGSL